MLNKTSIFHQFLICLIVLFNTISFKNAYADEGILTNSTVTEVTVYFDGARISRSANTIIPAGDNKIRIENISSKVDPNTIRASITGLAARIIAVEYESGKTEDAMDQHHIRLLYDSLQNINNQLEVYKGNLKALNEEEKMVLANRIVQRSDGIFIEDLEDVAEFFRVRLSNINKESILLNQKIKEIKRLKANFTEHFNYELSKAESRTAYFIVYVHSESRTSIILNLTYFVSDAGWEPVYELHAENLDRSIAKLIYKANISQFSGEDWKDVHINLAAGKTIGNIQSRKASLWTINFKETDAEITEKAEKTAARTVRHFTTSASYSVPSDKKNYLVHLAEYELNTSYNFNLNPLISPYASLSATIDNWKKLNLYPGRIHFFIENIYTGNTFLNPDITDEKLIFTMGTDKQISVEQQAAEADTKSRFLGNHTVKTIKYKNSISNKRNFPVQIQLSCQIPLSGSDEIEIKLTDNNGGTFNSETGLIHWNLNINPDETIIKTYGFSVKFPGGMEIDGM